MWKTFGIALLLLMAGATCFAQSTYKGLTPGKSTRAEVERVLGRPVNSVSKTLIEYKSADDLVRIYVQYSDESTTASVDRIELICKSIKIGTGYKPHECSKIWDKEFDLYDARTWSNEGPKSRERHYFGSSRYMLFTRVFTQGDPDPELRWAFYSKDLYDAAAPKLSGCTGTILGDWETNDGHLNIVRTGDLVRDANGAKSAPVRGTYSTNNGTFVGKLDGKTIYADWKDDTGTGKLSLHYLPLPSGVKISGDWERTTGTGPASGKWEGRCVNAE